MGMFHIVQKPFSPPHVVIVAYGSEKLLEACLETLGRAADRTIVDNGRSDAVEDLARRAGAAYLRPADNVGFAAGVNLALSHVEPGRDVLLLNPDARIPMSDVLRLQRELHDVPGCAAVAPLLHRPDGSVERTTWPMPSPLVAWAGVLGCADRVARRRFVSGAVLLLSGEALSQVGPFDERYFLYAEEVDWELRALRAGWTVREADSVRAEHLGAGTSSNARVRMRIFHGSAETFIRKWYGSLGWSFFRIGSIVSAARRALTARGRQARKEHWEAALIYLKGPQRESRLARQGAP